MYSSKPFVFSIVIKLSRIWVLHHFLHRHVIITLEFDLIKKVSGPITESKGFGMLDRANNPTNNSIPYDKSGIAGYKNETRLTSLHT